MVKTASVSPSSQGINTKTRAVSSTNQQREQKLICQAQQNDLDAFTELVDVYQNAVYRQAYWLLGEPEAAEDAAQEAFYRAYRKIYTFEGPSFRAWIMRITTNYCLDQLRRRRSHPSISLATCCEKTNVVDESSYWLIDQHPSPEQWVERSELRDCVRQCLLRLSPKYRVPIILVDIQEMNYQEAAQIMGIRLGSFKSRLSRGRAQLLEAALRMVPTNLLFS